MNLYQSNGNTKVCSKKGSAREQKHTSLSVNYDEGNSMSWVASGTGSLQMSTETLSANLQRNPSNLI